jgi:hypothetical protein
VVRTTPPPPVDPAALFPGIEAFARTATRLHPRPGTPDRHASHVGGPLLWPADEPWPRCDRPHIVQEETPVPAGSHPDDLRLELPGFLGLHAEGGRVWAVVTAVRPEPVPNPVVAVAQLRAADIPDLRCPDDADLLQVLWCPCDHPDVHGPLVSLHWRRADAVGEVAADPPVPNRVERGDEYLPRPCVLDPEQVVEYPWWEDLPAELQQRVQAWEADNDWAYQVLLSTAPGWKVGGWASWGVTDLVRFGCPDCGGRMELLMVADSDEWNGFDNPRWRPVEERDLRWGTREGRAAYEPTGVNVGRSGALRIFTCPDCPDVPPQVEIQ